MSSCLHAACVGIDVHVDVAWNVCSGDEKVFYFFGAGGGGGVSFNMCVL